jgi:hypothetical protein
VFAARIEMPVVLRGGMLDDRPALVPAGLVDSPIAHVPRRFGTIGWIAATAICAFSVYAVRDTMFAPLAQSDAPSSAWETKQAPGETAPPLIAASGVAHLDLEDHDESATGTTIDDDSEPDQLGPVSATTGTGGTGSANTPEGSSAGTNGGDATTSTAEATTSSAPSTSTPDTLGGHGANSGNDNGGSGNGSGRP